MPIIGLAVLAKDQKMEMPTTGSDEIDQALKELTQKIRNLVKLIGPDATDAILADSVEGMRYGVSITKIPMRHTMTRWRMPIFNDEGKELNPAGRKKNFPFASSPISCNKGAMFMAGNKKVEKGFKEYYEILAPLRKIVKEGKGPIWENFLSEKEDFWFTTSDIDEMHRVIVSIILSGIALVKTEREQTK